MKKKGSEQLALHPWDGNDKDPRGSTILGATGVDTVEDHRNLLDYPRSWLHQCDKESEAYQGAEESNGAQDETDWFSQQPDLVKSVFTRWGSLECPLGADVVYRGQIAGSYYSHKGGGANYLCLHSDPETPKEHSAGEELGNLLYGGEYRHGVKNNDQDAACVVCQRSGAVQTYVQWGRQTCTNGHHTEYAGDIMGNYYSHGYQKSTDICVDYAHAVTPRCTATKASSAASGRPAPGCIPPPAPVPRHRPWQRPAFRSRTDLPSCASQL